MQFFSQALTRKTKNWLLISLTINLFFIINFLCDWSENVAKKSYTSSENLQKTSLITEVLKNPDKSHALPKNSKIVEVIDNAEEIPTERKIKFRLAVIHILTDTGNEELGQRIRQDRLKF